MEKSRLVVSKGISNRDAQAISSLISMRRTRSLGKYLGFPLFQGRPKRADFHPIIEKIKGQLASWKQNLLNKAGRICLAKSALQSIPIYTMQVFWLP